SRGRATIARRLRRPAGGRRARRLRGKRWRPDRRRNLAERSDSLTTEEDDMPMPLEGVRVLDWTIWQQGPVCTAILGDLGADVIKIEERVGGDPGRGMLRLAGLEISDRPNFYFTANNRNKRGITLDLKKPEAREIVYQLAAKSDVFVQNFRKGVAGRLGLDYAMLKPHNPKLIDATATGYCPEGPESG